MMWVDASQMISILEFSEDMRGDGFISSTCISTGYEFTVGL